MKGHQKRVKSSFMIRHISDLKAALIVVLLILVVSVCTCMEPLHGNAEIESSTACVSLDCSCHLDGGSAQDGIYPLECACSEKLIA